MRGRSYVGHSLAFLNLALLRGLRVERFKYAYKSEAIHNFFFEGRVSSLAACTSG